MFGYTETFAFSRSAFAVANGKENESIPKKSDSRTFVRLTSAAPECTAFIEIGIVVTSLPATEPLYTLSPSNLRCGVQSAFILTTGAGIIMFLLMFTLSKKMSPLPSRSRLSEISTLRNLRTTSVTASEITKAHIIAAVSIMPAVPSIKYATITVMQIQPMYPSRFFTVFIRRSLFYRNCHGRSRLLHSRGGVAAVYRFSLWREHKSV